MTPMAISGRQPAVHAGYARIEAMTRLAAAGVRALWKQWLKIQRASGAARARRELHALNDRLLKDIGLRRSDIDSLFR